MFFGNHGTTKIKGVEVFSFKKSGCSRTNTCLEEHPKIYCDMSFFSGDDGWSGSGVQHVDSSPPRWVQSLSSRRTQRCSLELPHGRRGGWALPSIADGCPAPLLPHQSLHGGTVLGRLGPFETSEGWNLDLGFRFYYRILMKLELKWSIFLILPVSCCIGFYPAQESLLNLTSRRKHSPVLKSWLDHWRSCILAETLCYHGVIINVLLKLNWIWKYVNIYQNDHRVWRWFLPILEIIKATCPTQVCFLGGKWRWDHGQW